MNDIATNTPIVNVSLEYRQADRQSTMLEVEGKVLNIHVSILIDSGSNLSYIASKVVEKCKLSKEKNAWLVKLATKVKMKVTEIVKDLLLGFNDLDTSVNLNILPLGSYDTV